MATTKEMATKDGKRFYKIAVSRGYGVAPYTCRWYIPDGWSRRAIESGLKNAVTDFERKIQAGEVLSRKELKEAEQKAREAEALRAEEEAKILTLKQYTEKVFMPSVTITASEHTRASFQGNLDKHILPTLGGFKMKDVTSKQITALLLSKQAPKDDGKTLSHATVIKLYTILNLIFKKAYLDDTVPVNPMLKVQRPKPIKATGEIKTEVDAYTEKELTYIMECLQKESIKWQALINLLIDTGCRKGEALGLRWSDVDLKENCIKISHSLSYTPQKGIYLDTPKNGKSRTVYISDAVATLLKELKDDGKVVTLKGYVFTQDGSAEPMHPDSPNRWCKKFGDKYGIEKFHPHKLRHSFASIAITHNADIASVSEKLGHSDIAVTLRVYAHSNAEAQKRASEVFRQALLEKTGEA